MAEEIPQLSRNGFRPPLRTRGAGLLEEFAEERLVGAIARNGDRLVRIA